MKHSKFHVAMLLAFAVFVTGATIQTVITKLRQMQDVRLATSPTDGHVLTYNSSLGKWTNAAAAGAGSYVALNNGVATNLYLYGITTNTAEKLIGATASRAVILDADKFLTNSAVTSTELGYVSGVTSGIQAQFNLLSLATNAIQNSSGLGTNATFYGLTTIASTSGVSVNVAAAPSTNVVDLSVSSATNILNDALTILHATNGVTASERTHVRWFWTDGTTRALTIPSGWKTNVNSAVPASITNGTITRMFVTSIGDTSTSANQTNVFVSFEFYK